MSAVSRVLNLSRNRQAVRRFADRPVPPEILGRILECGRYASSAREDQPWRFVVVQDALSRHRIARAVFQGELVRTAPAVIACCARVHSNVAGSGRPSYPMDLAAATQAMALGAADMSLASAWITGFRAAEVREVLEIPADVPVVALLALGFPDGYQPLPARRAQEVTIAWDRWGATDAGARP